MGKYKFEYALLQIKENFYTYLNTENINFVEEI